MDAANDNAIVAQMDAIRDEIAASQKLVGEPSPTAELAEEYEDDVFKTKIQTLAATHPQLRRVRGDGNCFYRAFAFAILSQASKSAEDKKKMLETLKNTFDVCMDAGYDKFTTEDFYEAVVDVVTELPLDDVSSISSSLNDDGTSNYMVAYLRIVTSAYIKTHPGDYEPFFTQGETVASFCSSQVDPFGVECDNIQVLALLSAFGVACLLVYLDRSPGDAPAQHVVGSGQQISKLLFRPGHYDILCS